MAPSNRPLSPTTAPDLEILGEQVTIHPTGYVEPDHQGEPNRDETILGERTRFSDSPFDFLREISLHVSGSGWRAYEGFIGQPIYYPGFTDNMKAAVLSTPMLQAKIRQLAQKRVEVEEQQGLIKKDDPMYASKKAKRMGKIVESLLEVSEKMTDDMICKFESKRFIRGAAYLCSQLLTKAYHQGIHVSSDEVLHLKAVAEKAQAEKQSIVFLPCHRSHVDYVSLQLICYRLGLALPTVVAGDNLNFPLVGQFLQNAGAMYIRRSFGNDALYTTLVQSYMDALLKGGFNIECFIEGGRSRTGKLSPPKFGILSFILDSIISGRVEDTIICPVSTQYDKVIETEGYVNELLGTPKKKENLMDFLSASSVLSLKLGRVDVRFHEPWSLKEFIVKQQSRFNNIPGQLDLTEINRPEVRTRLLRTLGYKVLSDINAVSVVMPTALVGTILLTLRGRGVGYPELVRRVDWLCTRVRAKGGRVAHFAGAPTSVVVERALEVLGPELVGMVSGLPEDTFYAVDRFQLSFYRNMTIHLFISEALVSASMYMRVKQGGAPDTQRISYEELLSQIAFLSQLFRGEFIFPTEGLAVNLHSTLLGLEADNVIRVVRNVPSSSSPTTAGTPISIELSEAERACGRENFDFYCFLIWPFIEASWLGAVSLMGLTPPLLSPSSPNQLSNQTQPQTQPAHPPSSSSSSSPWLSATHVQTLAQLLGKTLYHQGDLSYYEAVNKEVLKNAYDRFHDEGILLISKPRDSRSPATLRLAPDWTPQRDPLTGKLRAGGRLWAFCERIARSRREGKNRRDGATVSTRVLALSERVMGELFRGEAGVGVAQGEGEGEERVVQKRRPHRGIESGAKL
ncbi:MAG: hypothetical protein M1824_001814 [Vezdaea acicularis]|nr:MAG: hypothetical protein M1824_001814 [Vezdaea acicularis]